jgi:hypothetical protein
MSYGVDYDESARMAIFTPARDLEYGRLYQATITAMVRDQAGNRLEADHAWHFTIYDQT